LEFWYHSDISRCSFFEPPAGKTRSAGQRKEKYVGRRSSKEDRGEGAMDKAKGRMKEAAGSLTGDEEKKAEGSADQTKGTAKEKKGKLKDLFK
jgi:uncharacterized protein YjbJ (UPF0337 family)